MCQNFVLNTCCGDISYRGCSVNAAYKRVVGELIFISDV